jgi:hypothetical protein
VLDFSRAVSYTHVTALQGVTHAMQHIVDPRQTNLFDPFKRILSPVAYRRIRRGWQGVFRHAILELMLADVLAGEFSPNMGTPRRSCTRWRACC